VGALSMEKRHQSPKHGPPTKTSSNGHAAARVTKSRQLPFPAETLRENPNFWGLGRKHRAIKTARDRFETNRAFKNAKLWLSRNRNSKPETIRGMFKPLKRGQKQKNMVFLGFRAQKYTKRAKFESIPVEIRPFSPLKAVRVASK